MDPITVSVVAAAVWKSIDGNNLVMSAFTGIIGNRADWAYGRLRQGLVSRLQNGQIVNHDVQRAVHEAYLNATRLACRACQQPLEKSGWSLLGNDAYFSQEAKSLRKISSYLDGELEKFEDKAYVPTTALALDGQIERLFVPDDAANPNGLADQLKAQVLADIAAQFGQDTEPGVPDSFRDSILTGWEDKKGHQDWFEWVCGFFHDYLKTRPRLSEILQKEWLADLKLDSQLVRVEVADVRQALAGMSGQVVELIALIKALDGKTDEILEYSRLIPTIHDLLKAQPQSPARAKYLNTFAHYDLANLVGRQQQLADMDAHFATHRLLLLRGMGGIGKTTLARAFISSRADGFDHIAYVEITSTIADALLDRLGTSPDVPFSRDPQKDTEANLMDLIEVLRHLPNTLLVIDNANDADDLRLRKAVFDSLPGHVLITSRARVQTYQQARNVLEVKKLTPDEARQLFGKLYGPLTEAETKRVDDILRQTDYHPKLVEVLAKAARENPLFELSTLETIVARKDYDHADISYPVELGEAEKPVYRILLDLFDTDPLDEATRQLLRYFSVLPTIDIPVRHLVDLLGLTDPDEKQTLVETLKKLTRSGWLDDLDNRVFAMHGLVQWVVRQRLQPTLDNCDALIRGTVGLIYRLSEANPLKAQPYVPYADALLAIFETDQNSPLTTLYGNTAVIYGALGQQDKRLAYNLKALAIREAVLPADHPDLARSFSNIALTYRALGQQDKELEYNLKALAIREAVLPTDHPALAQSFNNIAETYRALGQYDEALAYNLKALAIWEAVLPADHPNLAQSFNNIAGTYGALGQQGKRLAYDLKALAIREAVLSADHPDLAQSFNNIAVTYYYVDDLDKALGYMQQAVALRSRILPADHPHLLDSQGGLAFIEAAIRGRDGNGR
ncbi:MAG: tetratricopeptide repeat protein [Spirosoma sp.]|nr:tetratricopeptide repeat protein [Spirosoma sp.]